MIEPKTTKTYDLHLSYDSGYDDQPRVYARRLFLGKDGLWNTEDYDVDSYFFTEEDIDWIVDQFDLDGLSDLFFDEWFTTEDSKLLFNNLPPKALEWVATLPTYEYHEEED